MIHLEQVSATSRVRHWSAPVTLFCMGLLCVALIAPIFPGSILVIVSAWGMAWGIARVPFLLSLRLLSMPLAFLSISLCTLCISIHSGNDGIMVHWVSSQIPLAIHTGFRSVAALSATIALSLCVPMNRIFSLLRTLKVPEFILDFSLLMYRMIFILDDSRRQIWVAQRNRLGDANFRTTFRSLSLLVATLFLHSNHKAMRMEQGLAARCSTGRLLVLTVPQNAIPLWIWGFAVAWPITLAMISFHWRSNVI